MKTYQYVVMDKNFKVHGNGTVTAETMEKAIEKLSKAKEGFLVYIATLFEN